MEVILHNFSIWYIEQMFFKNDILFPKYKIQDNKAKKMCDNLFTI
jgi:hypothetical protein